MVGGRVRITLAALCLLFSPAAPVLAQTAAPSQPYSLIEAEGEFETAVDLHRQRQARVGSLRGVSVPVAESSKADQVAAYLRSNLPPATAVLFYDQSRHGVLAWLIDGSGMTAAARTSISEADFADLTGALRRSLGVDGIVEARLPVRIGAPPPDRGKVRDTRDQEQPATSDALARLGAIVLPPAIADGLAGVERLIVVGPGSITTLPFAILPLGDGTLVDATAIAVAPGLFDIERKSRDWNGRAGVANALVIGDPVVGPETGWDVPALPGAREEARSVAELLHGEALIGEAAQKSEIAARMPKAGLLYFASHGIADPDDPLDGGFLMFAGDSSENAFMTAREVQSMRLSADLAVLSACQTGLGQQHEGGTIGLARAFQIAGVPRVVMSLWSVSDAATQALMQEFSRLLPEQAPADALRHAMIETRTRFPDPALWGAFTLFGTPD